MSCSFQRVDGWSYVHAGGSGGGGGGWGDSKMDEDYVWMMVEGD